MGQQVVIGLDIGTTSTKAGAYRLDGSAVATAQQETTLHRRGPGAVEQDPHELLESAFATVAQCVAIAAVGRDGVAAIAVTGQMAGVMGIEPRLAARRAV
jgi:xylulokinase